ncbi:MAG: RidA family protein [Dehalococcoidia bacterium]|nr:RidA family protein [Dehalococcoidia bacterium]
MEKAVHNVDGLTKGGPYSHVVEAGGFVFVSGMVPIDLGKELMITDDIKEATKLVLNNVKKALESAGSGLDKVAKATVFLRDMADFNSVNEIYQTFFPENPPARTCVAVKEVPGSFPLEIEVIAIK